MAEIDVPSQNIYVKKLFRNSQLGRDREVRSVRTLQTYFFLW
jgi:hypothetical protein